MKSKNIKKGLLASALLCGALLVGCGNTTVKKDTDTLYQVALLQSLTAGQYDGVVTVEELSKHGDIGLGTFDAINGEMIVLDGVVYQALGDGTIAKADMKETVPFATVTYMDEDISVKDFESDDMNALKSQLDDIVKENGANYFYMIRMDGSCDEIKVRSELKQEKPYKSLDVVLASDQREYEYTDSEGTLVALYCPSYMDKLNTPGWHFHYLSADKTTGGHVLDVKGFTGDLKMDKFTEFKMVCPENEIFDSLDLAVDQKDRIKEVEQGK
ncbi:MAG: acetolactate decarboxylase [Lachnospiraceae bacterium]|nr:acetolactate decarboxylase [Lachnospiraceae bacterium]